MRWRDDVRTCKCGLMFIPKRERQRFCSSTCATKDRVTRHRSRYIEPTPTGVLYRRSRYRPPSLNLEAWATALRWFGQSGTFTTAQRRALSKAMTIHSHIMRMATYEDGYAKLPDCLDRRPKAQPLAKAA